MLLLINISFVFENILLPKNPLLQEKKLNLSTECLIQQIKKNNNSDEIEEIQLIGVCTDICVISNALLIKSFIPEASITIDTTCCAGVTPDTHKNAIEAMKMCHINII